MNSSLIRPAAFAGLMCMCVSFTLSADETSATMADPATESATEPGNTASGNKTPTAGVFLNEAGQAGLVELALGRIAMKKSSDPDVRAFAERMVKDHGAANAQLDAAAKSASMSAPTALDPEHRALVKAMEARSGADFDAEYASHMALDHAQAVALFQAAATADNMSPGLQRFAKATLPTLEEHKAMADELVAKTQMSSATTGSN